MICILARVRTIIFQSSAGVRRDGDPLRIQQDVRGKTRTIDAVGDRVLVIATRLLEEERVFNAISIPAKQIALLVAKAESLAGFTEPA